MLRFLLHLESVLPSLPRHISPVRGDIQVCGNISEGGGARERCLKINFQIKTKACIETMLSQSILFWSIFFSSVGGGDLNHIFSKYFRKAKLKIFKEKFSFFSAQSTPYILYRTWLFDYRLIIHNNNNNLYLVRLA